MEAAQATVRSGLSKAETRTTLASFNWNLGLRTVFDTVCGPVGMFFTTYVLALGIARESMGILGALVSAACICQVLGVALNSWAKDKKRFIVTLAIAAPLPMIAAVIAAPFVPPAWRLPLIGVAVFASASFLHLTKPVTDEWLASTVPMGLRGRFLSRRFQMFAGFAVITTLVMAYSGDELVKSFGVGGMAGVLVFGGLFGLMSARPLRRASLPPISAGATVRVKDLALGLREPNYRRYLVGVLIINVPFFAATAFYQAYFLDVLGLNLFEIAWMVVGYQLVKIPMLRFWGRRVDRFGSRRLMMLVAPMYAVFFFGMGVATPDMIWPIPTVWLMIAVTDAAWVIANGSLLYAAVPNVPARQAFFAAFNLALLGLYAVGGIAGSIILRMLAEQVIYLGPYAFTQFQLFYLGAAALMVPCSFGTLMFKDRPMKLAGRRGTGA